MADEVQVVTGSCTIGGESYGVNTIAANIAVNTWPYCVVGILSDSDSKGSAVQVDDNIFSKIGEWQTDILGGGLSATVHWATSGGISQTISGFVTNAAQRVSYNNLNMEVTILPDYTSMDAISLQFYAKLSSMQYALASDALPKLRNMTLMQYTQALVQALLKLYDQYAPDAMKDAPKDVVEQYDKQHQVNMENIHYFYDILGASEEYVKDLYGLKSMGNMHSLSEEGIKRVILESLTTAKGSFLSNICEYGNQFGLVYVPGADNPGHFIPKINMLDGNSGGGNNAIVEADIVASKSGFLPVGTVLALSASQGLLMFPHNEFGKTTVVAGKASADIGGPNRTVTIAPPRWMGPEFVVTKVQQKGTSPAKKSRTPEDANRAVEKTKLRDEAVKFYGKMMNDWCRQELANQLLGGSMTHQVTFLDNFECGIRRKEAFGTGFISGCTVNITVGNKSGAAATVYTYNLVFYKGASIPSF